MLSFYKNKVNSESDIKKDLYLNKYYSETPKPWVRFLARLVDMNIFIFCCAILFINYPFFKWLLNIVDIPLIGDVFVVFSWMIIESIMLVCFGTTLGKRLTGIKIVHQSKSKPSFFDALSRSIGVFTYGLALGLPFITLFTNYNSYLKLEKNGITEWDEKNNFKV